MTENRGFTPNTEANYSFLNRRLGVPYLIPSFAAETAIAPETKKKANELLINLGAWFIQTPAVPVSDSDIARYRRIPGLFHFTGADDYVQTVQSLLARSSEEDRRMMPPELMAALDELAQKVGQSVIEGSIGTTVFHENSDLASAIILQRPGTGVTEKQFLNALAEEVLHAASPRNTVLQTVRGATVNLVEFMNKYVRSVFLENYDPNLALDEEQDLFSLLREQFDPIRERVLNIHLRGRA